MADIRFKRLEQLRQRGTSMVGGTMRLAIPVPKTPGGKINRRCPNAACGPGLFQLGRRPENAAILPDRAAWMRRQPGDRGVTCPYCGDSADDNDFYDKADVAHATEVVAWAAKEDTADAFGKMIGRSLRHQRGGLRHGDMRFRRGPATRKPAAPLRCDLMRDLTCDTCSAPYGVFAIGLFCPDCGSTNVHVHFAREVELIEEQLAAAEDVGEEGSRELAYRLLGNAHEDVLTAMETYLKTLFRFVLRRRNPGRLAEVDLKLKNDFQNLDRGQERFVAELGFDPFLALSIEEKDVLRGHISKRHVVGHNLGMVDEKYARTARREPPGEIVHLVADEVRAFAELGRRVVDAVVESAPEFRPPSKGDGA